MTTNNSLILLENDWDDILWKLEGEVWVSYKVKDEKSVQGKVRCSRLSASGLPQLQGSDGFSVTDVTKDCVHIRYKDAPYTTAFIAASKVYSGIHNKGVTALSISPRGYSVSVCRDNQLVVWDFNQGQLKCVLAGHVGDVYKCKFFPSGQVVLSGGADMQLKIWCVETGRCPVTLTGHTMAVTDFTFIDEGKNILSVSKDGSAKLWSCSAGVCLGDVATVSATINCCHVFPAPPSLPLSEPHQPSSENEIGTKNKILLLGCEDGMVYGVAVLSRKIIFTVNCGSAVNSVTSLSDSLFVVGCHSGEVRLYSVTEPSAPVKTWSETHSPVLCVVAYGEDGFLNSHGDGRVVYRHIKRDDRRVELTGPDCDPVYELSVTQPFVYTCCRDSLIRRYAVQRIIQSFVNEE